MIEETLVATTHDIAPGRMHYVEIDGLPIALANVGGTIYAFGDACRHEGGSLSSGVLIDDTVTCPWHGWTYSVRTGKAIVRQSAFACQPMQYGSTARTCGWRWNGQTASP